MMFVEWTSRSPIKKLGGDELSVIFSFIPVFSTVIVVLLRWHFKFCLLQHFAI
jgi:hypothetical protein